MLVINAIARAKGTRKHNPGLWRANLAMIVSVICSISVVFDAVDPLVGNRSLLNCFTHLILVYVGCLLALATAIILQQLTGQKVTTLLILPWVTLVYALGVCGTSAVLHPGSSRGLAQYDQQMIYVLYLAATVASVVMDSLQIVPRFIKVQSVI